MTLGAGNGCAMVRRAGAGLGWESVSRGVWMRAMSVTKVDTMNKMDMEVVKPEVAKKAAEIAPKWRGSVAPKEKFFWHRGARIPRQFTKTGGSGEAASPRSESYEEACAKVRELYRRCLREIPNMVFNFVLAEPRDTIRDAIKSLFDANKNVTNPALIDVLVFKGRQEIEEIYRQWKGRHHIKQHLATYAEKLARVRNAQLLEQSKVEAAATPSRAIASSGQDTSAQLIQLRVWKAKKLIPDSVDTWQQYLFWRKEEDDRFAAFAEEQGLFSREELNKNLKYAAARGMGYSD